MIRIRLRRTGKKRQPYYRVVVANKTAKRDGAFLATLGSYDPHASPPLVVLDEAKTREWLGKGAQPSEAADKVLRRAGIAATRASNDSAATPDSPSSARKSAATAVAAKRPAGRAAKVQEAESGPATTAAQATDVAEPAAAEEAPAEPMAAEEEV